MDLSSAIKEVEKKFTTGISDKNFWNRASYSEEIEKKLATGKTDDKFEVLIFLSVHSLVLTLNEYSVYMGWYAIFKALKDESHKFQMYIRLNECFATGGEISFQFEKLQKYLPIAEKLKVAGVLDEVFEFLDFILSEQQRIQKQESKAKGRHQTASATASRRAYEKWEPIIKALWEYIQAVENKWHPAQQNTTKAQRSASHSQKISINSVFKEREEEITDILQNFALNGMEPKKAFARAFVVWTETCYERMPDHKTINGYSQEKRAPRSEASKERSRQAALKRRKK